MNKFNELKVLIYSHFHFPSLTLLVWGGGGAMRPYIFRRLFLHEERDLRFEISCAPRTQAIFKSPILLGLKPSYPRG